MRIIGGGLRERLKMAFYLQILASHAPIELPTDSLARPVFSINFTSIVSSYTGNITADIVAILAEKGIGQKGVNLLRGKKAPITNTSTWLATIIETGGLSPLESHTGSKQHRINFQIIVRDVNSDVASDKANEIYIALDGIRNKEVI